MKRYIATGLLALALVMPMATTHAQVATSTPVLTEAQIQDIRAQLIVLLTELIERLQAQLNSKDGEQDSRIANLEESVQNKNNMDESNQEVSAAPAANDSRISELRARGIMSVDGVASVVDLNGSDDYGLRKKFPESVTHVLQVQVLRHFEDEELSIEVSASGKEVKSISNLNVDECINKVVGIDDPTCNVMRFYDVTGKEDVVVKATFKDEEVSTPVRILGGLTSVQKFSWNR